MMKGPAVEKKKAISDLKSDIKYKYISEAEFLIDELMKEKPNQRIVKALMLKIGIPYSSDQINQMSAVLAFISDRKTTKSRKTPLTKKDMSI